MEKQTKILLGLAAAGVVAYLVFKPKRAVVVAQNTQDPYLCPSGYKLTPKPMGLSSMEVCEDENGNRAEKINNPYYVLKTLTDRGVDRGMGQVKPITPEEIHAYYDMMRRREEELGIPPDFIDNSDECRIYGICKM